MPAWCTVTDVRDVFPKIKGDSNYPNSVVSAIIYRAMRRMRGWLGGPTWGFTRAQMDGWETIKPQPVRDLTAEMAAALMQIDYLGLDIPNPEAPRQPEMATCQLTYKRIYIDCRDLVAGRTTVEDDSAIIAPQPRITMNKSTDDYVFIDNPDF